MNHQSQIDRFIRSLSATKTTDSSSLNIYEDAARSENLRHWLESFDDTPQSTIFIGEAPGVKGARITGIPFTSPDILNKNGDPWGAFGSKADFQLSNGFDHTQREATATIFWKHVNHLFAKLPRPMTWNAYPFWPHDQDARSNRHPNAAELQLGSVWLIDLIELYPDAHVIAVGNIAHDALLSIAVEHSHVRHPSHGGAKDFAEGLKRVADNLSF